MNLIVEYNLPLFFGIQASCSQDARFYSEECKQRDICWCFKYIHNGWRKAESHLEESININKVMQMEPKKPLVKHVIPKDCLQMLGLQWFLFFMVFLLLPFFSFFTFHVQIFYLPFLWHDKGESRAFQVAREIDNALCSNTDIGWFYITD